MGRMWNLKNLKRVKAPSGSNRSIALTDRHVTLPRVWFESWKTWIEKISMVFSQPFHFIICTFAASKDATRNAKCILPHTIFTDHYIDVFQLSNIRHQKFLKFQDYQCMHCPPFASYIELVINFGARYSKKKKIRMSLLWFPLLYV